MSLEGLGRRVRVLEDVEAIKGLKARYCFYCDDNYDADGITSLFVADGVWDGGESRGRHEGKEAIRRFFAESASNRYSFAMHNALNPLIVVDGDEAHGSWYLLMAATLTEGDQAIWSAGRYEEDYVRTGGEWKFQNLNIRFFFSTNFEKGWARQRFL